MATVKIKFRPSSVDGKEGMVYYQVIHGCAAGQINTSYKLFPAEWGRRHSRTVIISPDKDRQQYLLSLDEKIAEDIDRLKNVIAVLERRGGVFVAGGVTSVFHGEYRGLFFLVFMRGVIDGLKYQGKVRTVRTYNSALNSFTRFIGGRDVPLRDMDFDLIIAHEAWLKSKGISMSTISFYMHILRVTYDRTIERELITQHFPFKYVYMGAEGTTKRAVPLRVVKQLRALSLSIYPAKRSARDILLSSFYTRGMSVVDMAFLRKRGLDNSILTYRWKKTGQRFFVK